MVEVRPRTVWGHCQGRYASQRESGAYQVPMVPPAGVLTYGVVGGHLMQWWENSRRPHMCLPVAQQPVATKPAELTPSLESTNGHPRIKHLAHNYM